MSRVLWWMVGMVLAGGASAQTWPTTHVRIITAGAGGGSDFASRLIAAPLGATLGQQVIVENRGLLAADIAAKAAPDGYTMLFSTPGQSVIPLLLLGPKIGFDPFKEITPITLLARQYNALVVHPSVPARSVAELVALARKQPGKLSYGSSGNGSPNHLGMELFKLDAKIDLVHVPYKGAAPALLDVIAGQVQLIITSPISAAPHIATGKVRALATSGSKRNPLLPDLPTVAEAGLPGYEITGWVGVLVPAGTGRETIAVLQADIARALTLPDLKEKFAHLGAEAGSSTPEQFAEFIQSEIAKWGRVIRDAGIEPN